MILRRNGNDGLSTVLPNWKGETVVIVGGGPSFSESQVSLILGAKGEGRIRVIVINDGYLRIPSADVLYFADAHWWKWHHEGIPRPGLSAAEVRARFESFGGEICSIISASKNVNDYRVHYLRNRSFPRHESVLSEDPTQLGTGRHSGFQALNLGILAGANRALLVGMDGKLSPSGESHWFGEHKRPTPQEVFPNILRSFSDIEGSLKKLNVEVINCSPGSAINSFPRMDLDRALQL